MLTPPQSDLAGVVRKLTEAQRDLILWIGDDVKSAADLDGNDGERLFDMGLISKIQAAGYGFTDLTPLGQQFRALILSAQPRTRGE